ncbi:acylphosphatase domain-containing protein [Cordyceps javanica]|uniref:acylphosphatase n=1 Tax=Cordyceps javanica TaxID=43265 RepID=A0A545V6E5_9HYPO|nr:acylphosphatase domain-containing protein [Cordyceps javanica]
MRAHASSRSTLLPTAAQYRVCVTRPIIVSPAVELMNCRPLGVGFRYVCWPDTDHLRGFPPQITRVLTNHVRYFTRKRAQAYGLTGWCRNTPDNKVSEEASVEKLMKDVDQGPSHATVVKLTQEARDVISDEAEFTIRH